MWACPAGEPGHLFLRLCRLAALLLVLRILYKNDNPAYKIAWIVPILLMPFFGGLLYLVFGKWPT